VRLLLATTLFIGSTSLASAACALIGDSIAEDLHPYLRECQFAGRLGVGTAAIIPLVPSNAEVIIVSAGSNDYLTPGLLGRVQALRTRAGSARVIWIRPIPQIAANAVDTVAQAHGDAVVPFVVSGTDRERLHPQNNSTLAGDIRRHFSATEATVTATVTQGLGLAPAAMTTTRSASYRGHRARRSRWRPNRF
jgi:hypothetical protein